MLMHSEHEYGAARLRLSFWSSRPPDAPLHFRAPDITAGTLGRIVAFHVANVLEQSGLETRRIARKLDCKRRVLEHLNRLDPRDVVEKPGARGEHAERSLLHRKQLGPALRPRSIIAASDRRRDERQRFGLRTAPSHRRIRRALPRIVGEKSSSFALEDFMQLAGKPLETRRAEGRATPD